jgi:hypothetical protein
MAIDEQARHRLHQRLDEVLGPEEAAVLMSHLPPVGWADVATKQDIQALRGTFRTEHQALERVLKAEISSLGSDLRTAIANTRSALYRYSIVANSATVLAIFGMLLATGRL